jgi:ATP dependent DNA ligase domain
MRIKRVPAGFVVPAQPIKASKPPVGTDWVHEIKHDGDRIIVRRDGPAVRLYSRNAYDWTVRLAAIAAAAERITAKSFTIDGEAVVRGPDGLSRFEECRKFDPARHDLQISMKSASSCATSGWRSRAWKIRTHRVPTSSVFLRSAAPAETSPTTSDFVGYSVSAPHQTS